MLAPTKSSDSRVLVVKPEVEEIGTDVKFESPSLNRRSTKKLTKGTMDFDQRNEPSKPPSSVFTP